MQNLRSVKDSTWLPLTSLNILVGPNNSGKSSLLAALLLLKQTLQDQDTDTALVTTGQVLDMGSYLDIVPGAPEETPLQITFQLEPDVLPSEDALSFSDRNFGRTRYDWVNVEFGYEQRRNEVFLKRFEIRRGDSEQVLSGHQNTFKGKWKLTGLNDIVDHIALDLFHFLPQLKPFGNKPEDSEILSRVFESMTGFLLHSQAISHLFQHLHYIGPVRQRIPYYGTLGTMPSSEMGPSGENLLKVLAHVPSMRSPLKELNSWLGRRFELIANVHVKPIGAGGSILALLGDDLTGRKRINLAATGSGVSQLVPIVVQTALMGRASCVVIEQPELHLHPAAQAVLGDLLLESSSKGQILVETHSEHVILRIRRRVAEGKIDPRSVSIFLVEKKDRQTSVRRLELDKNGHFLEWPEGFLDEGYREAMALAEANAKRSGGSTNGH